MPDRTSQRERERVGVATFRLCSPNGQWRVLTWRPVVKGVMRR